MIKKYLYVFLIITCCLLMTGNVYAASKSSLIKKVKRMDGGTVAKTFYNDFDGDGKKELFAILGSSELNYRLWFASNREVMYLPIDDDLYLDASYSFVTTVSKKQKIFSATVSNLYNFNRMHVFYVKKGKVYYVKKIVNGVSMVKDVKGLSHYKGNLFYAYSSDYDHYSDRTGRTCKRYYVKWTGTDFKEYVGKEISLSALKKYSGANSILKKAKKLGYSVSNIYKRGNGIINVNLYKKEKYSTRYENLTLKIKGNKVSLVEQRDGSGSSDWIYKYSYGGRYLASGAGF